MRRYMTLVCVPAIIVMLAACGSSSSSKSAKTSSTKATSTTAGSATAVVKTANSAKLGKIVVTSAGKTVYTLSNNGASVPCTGACLTVWPAVLLPAGETTATGGEGVTGLGDTAAAGGQQVTLGGKPVYTFSVDTSPGDTKGDGITSFGGTWHVVKVGSSSSATTSTPTTSGGSSGY